MSEHVAQNVLIVERDAAPTRLLLEALAARGIRGTVVRDVPAARERLERGEWQAVVADLGAAGGGGLAVLRYARLSDPELPVVLTAGDPSVERAVAAMRAGGEDVLVRPLQRRTVEALLDRLVPNRSVPAADAAADDGRTLYRIVGRSRGLLEALAVARRVAPTSVAVLISGETGTGKELVAHLIHRTSRRADGPYVRLNCAALTESLLESELFGHVRGAFTGAVRDRKGRFELAHGGTLLLDEVTETGPRLQAELLRVLEEQEFQPVGGSQRVSVSVRVLATTNRDLAGLVREGRFRADLYYRLAGVRVNVPPLRRRREDLPLLAWHFVNQFAREARRAVRSLDPEMMEVFRAYDWPGNVRQLRNVVRTATILGTGDALSLAEAPWLAAELRQSGGGTDAPTLNLRDVERRAILKAVRLTDFHQGRAAELLGITDRTLRDKLRRYREEGYLDDPGDRQWLKEPA